jgi:hypothetical protein
MLTRASIRRFVSPSIVINTRFGRWGLRLLLVPFSCRERSFQMPLFFHPAPFSAVAKDVHTSIQVRMLLLFWLVATY